MARKLYLAMIHVATFTAVVGSYLLLRAADEALGRIAATACVGWIAASIAQSITQSIELDMRRRSVDRGTE